jgi:hypothetical protein
MVLETSTRFVTKVKLIGGEETNETNPQTLVL